MLNELVDLSKSLTEANIESDIWHKDLKPLPKYKNSHMCYKIHLSNEADITEIEISHGNLIKSLRKYEPSNGHSFPSFNLIPLFKVSEENESTIKNFIQENKYSEIFELLAKLESNWTTNFQNKLNKCLKEVPCDLNSLQKDQEISSRTQSENRDLNKLFSIVLLLNKIAIEKSRSVSDIFKEKLLLFLKKARNFDLLAILYERDKKSSTSSSNIPVYLELAKWDEYPIASIECTKRINQLLISTDDTIDLSNNQGKDAYDKSMIDSYDKLPSIRLPILGDVTLRAMSKESPCQRRYKTIDAVSFPVGKETRIATKMSLEWLSDDVNKNKTWGMIDDKTLFFAYPTRIPPIIPEIVKALGANYKPDRSVSFVALAKEIITLLSGKNKNMNRTQINCFVLRKLDRARTKVDYLAKFGIEQFEYGANTWEEGCANIPRINIQTETNGLTCPMVPPPLFLARCLNNKWKKNGEVVKIKNPLKDVTLYVGIDVLLDRIDARGIQRLVSVFVKNSINALLLFNKHRFNLAKDYEKICLPSVAGLLLLKLNLKKEVYMLEAPFLIGELMKHADDLHQLYCDEVRGKKYPPQLIGNSLMSAALESPIQSLSILSKRLLPYLAWAKTNQTGQVNLARYFLKKIGEVSNQLAEIELPKRFNDTEKVKVFLGYLKSNRKEKVEEKDE